MGLRDSVWPEPRTGAMSLKTSHSTLMNKRGFSLVETMVGVALLGIAAVTAMQMTGILLGSARDNAFPRIQFSNLESQIYQMISTEAYCRLAIGGPDTLGGGVKPYTQVLNAGPAVTNIKLYQTIPGVGARPVFADPAGALTEKTFGILTLTKLYIKAPNTLSSTEPVPVQLSFEVQHIQSNGNAAKQINESTNTLASTIAFSVLLNGANQIVSCFPLSYASDGNPAKQCASDEALTVNSTGAGATETKLVCRKVLCAPPKKNYIGYDTDGNVICGP
jgi:prepilin-type N-terminal cleavage/methylation domain-containing protein